MNNVYNYNYICRTFSTISINDNKNKYSGKKSFYKGNDTSICYVLGPTMLHDFYKSNLKKIKIFMSRKFLILFFKGLKCLFCFFSMRCFKY